MTEAELVARLARDLGPLAVDAAWSSAASAGQPYGHYSDPIADAKVAMNIEGELVNAGLVSFQMIELRDRALFACLERLELHYSTLVDTSGGEGAAQKLSQLRLAVGQVAQRLAKRVGASALGVRLRGRARPDYSLGSGDEEG